MKDQNDYDMNEVITDEMIWDQSHGEVVSAPQKKQTLPVGLEISVLEFMSRAGQLQKTEFGDCAGEARGQRIAMMIGERGEVKEYMKGEVNDDLVETLDGLADICWIAIGTMYKYVGPQCALEIMQEVADSNLAKVDGSLGDIKWAGEPGNSKVLKPEGWRPPNVRAVLEKHGWKLNEKGQPIR